MVGTGSEKLEGIRENREGIGMADKLAGFVPDWVEQERRKRSDLKARQDGYKPYSVQTWIQEAYEI